MKELFFTRASVYLGQENVKSSSDEKAEENGYDPPHNVFVFLCEVNYLTPYRTFSDIFIVFQLASV